MCRIKRQNKKKNKIKTHTNKHGIYNKNTNNNKHCKHLNSINMDEEKMEKLWKKIRV